MKQKTQRNTRQRQSIYAAIVRAGRPLTPQEILSFAQQEVPGLGIATIYRNIKVLLNDEAIRAVELPGEELTRYEEAQSAHTHHHHFLCKSCNRAFEVHGCAGDFNHMVPDGFKMHDHEITLYGYCKECLQKNVMRGKS